MQPTKSSLNTTTPNSRRAYLSSTNFSTPTRNSVQVDEHFRPHFQATDNLRGDVESQQNSDNERIQQDLSRRDQQMQEREQIFEQRLTERQNNIEARQMVAQRRLEGVKQQNRRELEEKKQALQNVNERAEQLAQIRLATQQARQEQSSQSTWRGGAPKGIKNTDNNNFSEKEDANPECVIS